MDGGTLKQAGRVKITNHLLTTQLTPRNLPYEVWDAQQPGLLVRVYPSGVRSYVVQYGRGKRYTLSRVDETPSVHAARDAAAQVRSAFRLRNEDPHDARFAKRAAERARRDAERAQKLEAKAQRRAARDAAKQARLVAEQQKAAEQTLGQFVEHHFFTKLRSRNKDRQAEKDRLLGAFATLLDTPLSKLTSDDVNEWVEQRNADDYAQATIVRDLAYLKPILRLAHKLKLVPADPCEDLNVATPDNMRVRFLDDDEEKRLYAVLNTREKRLRRGRKSHNAHRVARDKKPLQEAPKEGFADYMYPLILMAQHTGMRRGELFSLRWGAVNFDLKILAGYEDSHHRVQSEQGLFQCARESARDHQTTPQLQASSRSDLRDRLQVCVRSP